MREKALAAFIAVAVVLSIVAPAVSFIGTASATPQGFVGVPDENISSDLPPQTPMGDAAAMIEEQGVLASDNASTLEVIVTNPGRAEAKYMGGELNGGGPVAIVLRDNNNNSAGRTVGLPADALKDALGYVPEMAYGTYEDGTEWHRATELSEDGKWVLVEIPHFSTNTVTWTGLFTIDSTSIDGAQHTYTQNDSDIIQNYIINVTGSTAYEWDNQSSTFADGDPFTLDVAGNADPIGPSGAGEPRVIFTGTQSTGSQYTPSGTGTVTGLSINGDTAPSGPNGGEPEITFTGVQTSNSRTISQTAASNGASKSFTVNGNLDTTNGQVTFTGNENEGAQTTDSGSGDGSIDPAGNLAPVGPSASNEPEITFVGTQTTGSRYSPSGSGDGSITVNGDDSPSGPSSGEPEITFTGTQTTGSRYTPSGTGDTAITINGDDSPTGPNGGEPEITLTGNENTGSQTTDTGSDGGTINPAGNIAPVGPSSNSEPEVTFVGKESTTSDNYGASGVSPTYTESISVDGNLQPTDGSGSNPQLSITGHTTTAELDYIDDLGDGQHEDFAGVFGDESNTGLKTEHQFTPSFSSDINAVNISIEHSDSSDQSVGVDVYIVGEAPDTNYGEGTMVGSFTLETHQDGHVHVPFDTTYSVTSGNTYTLEFISDAVDNGGSYDEYNLYYDDSPTSNVASKQGSYQQRRYNLTLVYDSKVTGLSVSEGTGTSVSYGDFSDGQTITKGIDLSTSSSQLDFSGSGGSIDYSLTMTERTGTEDPRVDVTGDSTADASASGVLSSGQTTTVELAALDETSQTVDTWTATAGPAPDWEITYSPHYATENPTVDYDNDGTDEVVHSGILTSGQTSTYQISGLQEGSRTVNLGTAAGPQADWTITYDEELHTHDPSVDVDGDGNADASYTGELADGQSDTAQLTNLPLGSVTVDASISSGAMYDWTITYDEELHTHDPAVDIDGDSNADASYTGELADGATATKELANLDETSQTVNVWVGSGAQTDWDITYSPKYATENPGLDLDGDGTDEASYSGILTSGQTASDSVNLAPGSYTSSVSLAASDVDWSWSFDEQTGTEDPSVDIDGDGSSDASYSGVLSGGQTTTKQLSALQTGTVDVDTTVGSGNQPDWTITYDEELYSHDPAIDLGGDGTDEASYAGILSPGQTATYELSSLNTSHDTATMSVPTGQVQATVEFQEVTKTADPVIEVNGNQTSYTGELADGERVALSTDKAWVNDGANTINVTTAPGVSSDAPTPELDLYYAHDGIDDSLVNYVGEKFSERYNVSKTFGKDQADADLDLQFVGPVTGLREHPQVRVNGGSWQDSTGYTFDSGNLTVDLGAVSAGDTVEVKVTGSKISVTNGDVDVTDPTDPDADLNSKMEVKSRSSGDLIINLGSTGEGERLSYTYEESWDSDTEYATFTYNGDQSLVIPDAGNGTTFRVTNIPLEVNPQSGDVVVQIVNASDQPSFDVSPGPNGGNTKVEYTLLNAQDGEDYILYSETHGVVRSSGTASSPLTLSAEDIDEVLTFKIEESTASSSDGTGGGGGGGAGGGDTETSVPADFPPISQIVLLGGLGLGLFGALIFIRRTLGSDPKEPVEESSGTGIVGTISGVLKGFLVAIASAGFRVGSAARSFFTTRLGIAVVGVGVVLALYMGGFIGLTGEERTIILAVSILIGGYVTLRRIGMFSWPLFALVSVATLALSLNAMGTDLFTTIIESPVFPIVAIGALALAYYYVRAWRKGQTTNITIRGTEDDDNDE